LKQVRFRHSFTRLLSYLVPSLIVPLLIVGCTASAPKTPPTVTITASPTTINSGASSTLTVTATNATSVKVTGTGTNVSLAATGGTTKVSPTATTTYTATATGAGGTITAAATVTVNAVPVTAVTITASPATIFSGDTSTLTVKATLTTAPVTVTAPGGISYTLSDTGGTVPVSPTATITYTATATGTGSPATATATVTVNPSATAKQSVQHVIFMMQENHSFDNYFGMLNPYRQGKTSANSEIWNVGDDGLTYNVDGIDASNTHKNINNITNPTDPGAPVDAPPGTPDPPPSYSLFKFTSQCIDDLSSGWLASFGDVDRYNFTSGRAIDMTGFVHNANGYAQSCRVPGAQCSGTFTGDYYGKRSMGYYDQDTLNYYYYMASQFALSDRWFSPVASKTIDNRIATFTGGTTQGLVQDPGGDDHLDQNFPINTILQNLTVAKVSWKVYYTVTLGFCLASESDDCSPGPDQYPATDFNNLSDATNYLRENPNRNPSYCATLIPALQPSSTAPVNDTTNSFCFDPNHIAPISQYYADLTAGTLPSFAFIEPGYANNDEHPGSGQPIGAGQAEVAKVVNAFMASSEWSNSIFFFAFDEGGGPYDHVPPVPGHSNAFTDTSSGGLGYITGGLSEPPDISGISVNPDPAPGVTPVSDFFPCVPPNPPGTATTHCDLHEGWPGAPASGSDVVTENGFGAQLGFRVPNFVISPFSRKHYVSHIPMDHTAIIRFVEDLFIGNGQYLTKRDAVQPKLLDFFDFNNVPWATPPTPPTPVAPGDCNPSSFAP
jgi:phospholipase C